MAHKNLPELFNVLGYTTQARSRCFKLKHGDVRGVVSNPSLVLRPICFPEKVDVNQKYFHNQKDLNANKPAKGR